MDEYSEQGRRVNNISRVKVEEYTDLVRPIVFLFSRNIIGYFHKVGDIV